MNFFFSLSEVNIGMALSYSEILKHFRLISGEKNISNWSTSCWTLYNATSAKCFVLSLSNSVSYTQGVEKADLDPQRVEQGRITDNVDIALVKVILTHLVPCYLKPLQVLDNWEPDPDELQVFDWAPWRKSALLLFTTTYSAPLQGASF